MITQISKRNGSIVDFEPNKIRQAIYRAAIATRENFSEFELDELHNDVLKKIEFKYSSTDVFPSVESIQDIVEITLMKHEYFDIAKGYILYRSEHQKARQKSKDEMLQKINHSGLEISAKSGKKTGVSYDYLLNLFKKYAHGLSELDLTMLTTSCASSVFDGMTEEDLRQIMIMSARSYIEKDPEYSTLAARIALDKLYKEVVSVYSGKFTDAYKQAFKQNIEKAVATNRLEKKLLSYDLDKLANELVLDRDGILDYLGFQVLSDRYFLQDEGGKNKLETPQAFWMRVAMGLAMNEGKNKYKYALQFYHTMSQLEYVPSTPTLFHAGTTFPQLSSCYLNTVEDDLTHIFKVYGDNAQLSKYSGGIGTDWTNLRGTGALIKKTNVGSQGVVPFLKIANDVTVAINRSGKRRGATCAYLEVWHYDFEDFLDLRKNTGDERRRTHDMNTAAWIPDLFMKRVLNDGDWFLFSPNEVPDLHHIYGKKFEKRYAEYEKLAEAGKMTLFRKISAKELWRKMITMLFETGHPWITFKDSSNVRSPQDHAGVIHNSNLCTEITLNNSAEETAVCNLGSINLSKFILGGKLNQEKIAGTVKVAVRMLDNVIDMNYYPTKEAENSNMRHRPVGLGIMGFQDALYLQGINFNSDEAINFADESMETISYHAILASSLLAQERGAYQSFKGSKWDRGIMPIDTLDLLEKERGETVAVDRGSKLDWGIVKKSITENGLRNSNLMAIAPTATISNISGCYPCIEPIYKNLYVKSNMSGEFTVVNKYLINDLKKIGLWNDLMLEQLKRNEGSVQNITSIPLEIRERYKEVFEIESAQLIKIAAQRGKWIDQSQSMNVFAATTSGKYLSDAYFLAWKMGLKTTYYLRTIGASSIEKSTITLKATEDPISQITVEQKLPKSVVANVALQAQLPEIEMKVCLINDPECEACQ
jgi:ribonucleoside-diphosphate reductase alpha chain